MAGRQNHNHKDSMGNNFEPLSSSTPIRSQHKKSSIYERLAGAETSQNKLIDNVSNTPASDEHDTLTNNRNTSTPKDKTYQKNQIDDSELTLVPAAKPVNETVIPETQEDHLTESERNNSVSNSRTSNKHDTVTINGNTLAPMDKTYQKVGHEIDESGPSLVSEAHSINETVIPETQDDQIPETQEARLPTTERNNSITSTPTRSQRNKSSIHEHHTGAKTLQNKLSDSVSNARASVKNDTVTINRHTLTPKNKTYQKVIQENQIDDSVSTLVPTAKPANESMIPETQDVGLPERERNNSVSHSRTSVKHDTVTINGNALTPKDKTYRKVTQEIQNNDSGSILVAETQPVNESVIPETQDNQIPETQEEPIPDTEQNDSVSNAQAPDTHDAPTNNQNIPAPSNKTNQTLTRLNAVVRLSPLSDEILRKHGRRVSVVPMDLVLTPPTIFQNSRRTSQFENDNLIVEASPSTRENRKKQLEQRNFDQVCSLIIFNFYHFVLIGKNKHCS